MLNNNYYFTIFLLLIMSNFTMAESKYKKPYYGIKLDLTQVGVDIRLNDIPIYYDDEKGQLSVDLPATTSVINGKNELKIIAFPPYIDDENKMDKFLPGAEVSVTLYVQEYDDQSNTKETLSNISIKYNNDHKAEILTSSYDSEQSEAKFIKNTTNSTIVNRTAEFKSGFPTWQWQSGVDIENTKDNFNTLLSAYKNIYSSFKEKNSAKVKDLYKNRAKETAIAFYLENIEQGHSKISTGEDMNDPSLKLHDFWLENMFLDIFANGKMARIIDKDNDQPILFVDKESGTLHLHKFGFYKNKNNEWILIR